MELPYTPSSVIGSDILDIGSRKAIRRKDMLKELTTDLLDQDFDLPPVPDVS
jgi:hypothetical protein